MSLSAQLAIASVMVAVTAAVHLVGIASLLLLFRQHRRVVKTRRIVVEFAALLVAVMGLFGLHTVEIWLYAALYSHVGALPDFEDALYFSTSTYTTVGYGDLILPRSWRLVGAIEGANGIILLGWSTAFFVGMVGRVKWLEHALETPR
jgi:hypothetical protein